MQRNKQKFHGFRIGGGGGGEGVRVQKVCEIFKFAILADGNQAPSSDVLEHLNHTLLL